MYMRRQFILAMIPILLTLLLVGCQEQNEELNPNGSVMEVAAFLVSQQRDMPDMYTLSKDEEDFSFYLTEVYGIGEEQLEEGVICYAGGVEASEVSVLAFRDPSQAQAAEDILLNYMGSRSDSFTGYVPEQAALAENGIVAVEGRYVALLICTDPEQAQDDFQSCFTDRWSGMENPQDVFQQETEMQASEQKPDTAPAPSPEVPIPQESSTDLYGDEQQQISTVTEPSEKEEPVPPEETSDLPSTNPSAPPAQTNPLPVITTPEVTPDVYDGDAVLAAWEDQDPSGLQGKSRAVYDLAVEIIGQYITDDMSDYEKELAIHDYITHHGDYDQEANSNAPDASPDPDNDNPYGMLIKGVGICRGYASTFQLFMDMLGIECITVPGFSGDSEHAWNMVRLAGEWYCVDVTWDDPSGGSPGHRYFNVTSEFLRNTNHQWDESTVPEADATDFAWRQA